ncbi:D-sedoheptulose 7-phosphate isomerase [Succinatimonas hippei]|uniref:D-sedoheptulose 7-phosphate isomerase n=1 Tax=Succinatimonas hippei TaxID=626938 RepID=UPI002011D9CA|nr:D-sedoheptulose 7-phosphate isomerase [Succinatimonas hippei]MCL1603007.1 D-sedoheptulose 7-phosphate isomerase [Succinatimonas hippei]MDM8119833.1 D-sedoheptulose 7-phosphate isomerase [Succinatimonas hippei]
MLSFSVMDDLKEASKVLNDFINKADTEEKIEKAISLMADSIKNGGKIISAGNGGSMCDAQHFAEELSGRYRNDRPAYPAIAVCDPSHLTCVGNDYGFDYVFSRFLEGLGFKGDVFLGISTSGNSRNIIECCKVCKDKGLKSVVLLGKDGGKLKDVCDLPIIVPHFGYADRIQEVHTMIIHIMIRGIEDLLAKK